MLNSDFDLFWQILSGSGDPVGSMQLRPWLACPHRATQFLHSAGDDAPRFARTVMGPDVRRVRRCQACGVGGDLSFDFGAPQ
jgi:hypothetical protein